MTGLKFFSKSILYFLLPLLICSSLLVLSNHKQAKADTESYRIYGKVYSETTYLPMSNVYVSLDDNTTNTNSLENSRETVTSVNGFFDLTVPSKNFSHLYIYSDTNNPYYYTLEGSVDWLSQEINTNISIKEGYGAENVEIIPIIEGNNLISTRLEPYDTDFQNVFSELVDDGTERTKEDLPIDGNRLSYWDSEQQTSFSLDESPNPPTQLESMRSYWYYSDKNTALVIKGKEVMSERQAYLWGEGMQIISSSWGTPFDIRNLTVTNYEQTLPLYEAIQAKWIDKKFSTFDAVTKVEKEYFLNSSTDQIYLAPGQSLYLSINCEKLKIIFPAYVPESQFNNVEIPSDITLNDIELVNEANAEALTDPAEIARESIVRSQLLDTINVAVESQTASPDSPIRLTRNGRYIPLARALYAGEIIEDIEPPSFSPPVVQEVQYPVEKVQVKEINYYDASGNLQTLKIKLEPKNLNGGVWSTINWTNAVVGFRDKILPQLLKLVGPPLLEDKEKNNGVVVFKIGYDPTLLEEGESKPGGLTLGRNISLARANGLNDPNSGAAFSTYTHELLHAWYGNWSVADVAVDEILTEGGAWVMLQNLGAPIDDKSYTTYYEQFNRLDATTRNYYLDDLNVPDTYKGNNRYILARATYKKIYYENQYNNFMRAYFKKVGTYNAFVYGSIKSIPSGRTELIDTIPTVERQDTKTWLNNQVITATDRAKAGQFGFTYVYPNNQIAGDTAHRMDNVLFNNSVSNLQKIDGMYKSTAYKNGSKQPIAQIDTNYNFDRRFVTGGTLDTDRYSKFTWMNVPKNIKGLNTKKYQLKSFSSIGFGGIQRPCLWGIIDTPKSYSGTAYILPINPHNGQAIVDSSGKTLSRISVPIENGVFESNYLSYGLNAGTFKIEVEIPGYPTYTKIITKGPGEYFTFLKMQKILSKPPTNPQQSLLKSISDYFVQKANATETISDELSISEINTTLTDTGASISFNTSAPTIGAVIYGETEECELGQEDFNSADTSQTVSLSGLTDGKTYHYKIIAAAGDEDIVVSDDQTFTYFNISIDPVTATNTSATIKWHTTVDTKGSLEYGLDTNYGKTSSDGTVFKKDHAVTIAGLETGKTYHFRIVATANDETTKISEDKTFIAKIITYTSINLTNNATSPLTTDRVTISYDTVTNDPVDNTPYSTQVTHKYCYYDNLQKKDICEESVDSGSTHHEFTTNSLVLGKAYTYTGTVTVGDKKIEVARTYFGQNSERSLSYEIIVPNQASVEISTWLDSYTSNGYNATYSNKFLASIYGTNTLELIDRTPRDAYGNKQQTCHSYVSENGRDTFINCTNNVLEVPGGSTQEISIVYYQYYRDSYGNYIFPIDFYLNGMFRDRILIENQDPRPEFNITDRSILHNGVSFKNIRNIGSYIDYSTPYPWATRYYDVMTNDLVTKGRVSSSKYSDNVAVPPKYSLSYGSTSTSIINSGAIGSWYFYIYNWEI